MNPNIKHHTAKGQPILFSPNRLPTLVHTYAQVRNSPDRATTIHYPLDEMEDRVMSLDDTSTLRAHGGGFGGGGGEDPAGGRGMGGSISRDHL